MDNRFKTFFKAESSAVLPLTGGLKYTEMGSTKGSSATISQSKETKDLINDLIDFISMGLAIPPALLKFSAT